MPDASVVIATRDRADRLEACLGRLARQTAAGAFEVLVIDNGSSDRTPRVIEAAKQRGEAVSALFVADPNRGKARNAGIAAAAGAVVIFCDDDTLAPPHFVEAHLRARGARPHAVVSGPIINVADERTLPAPGPQHFSRAFLCTCNASVERSALLEVGGFDERYDLYGWEDTDLGVRLHDNGAKRMWSWDAYLYHVKPPKAVTLESR